MNKNDYSQELSYAVDAALNAGKYLLKNKSKLNEHIVINPKDTKLQADVEAENLIKKSISSISKYPILAEESGKSVENLGEIFWVVDPLVSLCPDTYSHLMDVGDEYMNVSNYFGGMTLDICETDWTAGVNQAIQQVHLIDEIALDYTPVDVDHIEVFVDNILWTDWTWDEPNNKIVFSIIPPEGSIITVSYNYL